MSGWRVAKPDELARLWPAARTSHVATSLDDLREFYAQGPWKVRVSSSGDAMMLAPWRAHSDTLAIRGLWVAEHRVEALVEEARGVARAQGFSRVLTPLLARSLHAPYERAGMTEIEPIVALQGIPGRIALRSADERMPAVRTASRFDLERIEGIDRECFNEFWRYGTAELEGVLATERLTVSTDAGEVIGYASATIRNGTCTLGRLAIAPEARRRGAGRALVVDVAEWAALHSATVLSLCTQESNSVSRALYASCGLLEIEERYGILEIDA